MVKDLAEKLELSRTSSESASVAFSEAAKKIDGTLEKEKRSKPSVIEEWFSN